MRALAECHPDRRHHAKGLCPQCYRREYFRAWREVPGNQERANVHNKNHYLRYPERKKVSALKYDLRARYGITVEEREAMFEAQGRRCAICFELRPLCIDHDHARGILRGGLCRQCNLVVGWAKDSVDVLRSAISYLERYACQPATPSED